MATLSTRGVVVSEKPSMETCAVETERRDAVVVINDVCRVDV